MIVALAKAGQAFNEPRYTQMAATAAAFVLAEMRLSEGCLLHRYRNGEAAIHATVDDYAFLIWSLLDLYEATLDQRYLETAIALNDEFVSHFLDSDEGGFFFTPDDGEHLLARPKEGYDGALPSGNSVAMLNQLRLGRFTGDTVYDERATRLSWAFAGHDHHIDQIVEEFQETDRAIFDCVAVCAWRLPVAVDEGLKHWCESPFCP